MLKFRAWHKKKVMANVTAINFENKTATIDIETTKIHGEDASYWHQTDVKLEQIELMQYTGLKDRCGNKIYEGDIVKQEYNHFESYVDRSFHSGVHVGEVVMTASKGACLKRPLNYPDNDKSRRTKQYKNIAGYRAEVIGNIYQNTDIKY